MIELNRNYKNANIPISVKQGENTYLQLSLSIEQLDQLFAFYRRYCLTEYLSEQEFYKNFTKTYLATIVDKIIKIQDKNDLTESQAIEQYEQEYFINSHFYIVKG